MNISLESHKQIKFGAIISYSSIFFNIVAGLLYTPWMIHKIGQSNYALYALALSVIGFFTIDFGLGEAVSRFLTRFNAEGKIEKVEDFLGITFKLYIIIDIIFIFILFFIFLFIDDIYKGLTASELYNFKIVFSIASLYSIASFPFMPLNGILISNEKFIFLKSVDLLNRILTVFTMVMVLILGFKLFALVFINAIFGLLTIIIKVFYIWTSRLAKINIKANDKKTLKSIFSYSMWSTIILVSQRFIITITPTILAAFSGSVQVSFFAIAMSIEGYIWTFASALNGLFLPKVTRIIVEYDDSRSVENLMIKVGRLQLLITGLAIIGFISMGKEFVTLWLSKEYIASYYIACFLIINGLITLTQQIANTALIALNEIKYRAFCILLYASTSVSLSLLLSQKYGGVGSAFAIFIGGFLGSVVALNLVYRKKLKIDILRFFKECHLKMAAPMLLTFLLAVAIQCHFPVESLKMFVLKVALVACTYVGFMWFLALNKYEKNLLFEFAGIFKIKNL